MNGSLTCPGEKGLSIILGDCSDSSYLSSKKRKKEEKKSVLFIPESRFITVFIMKTDHLAFKND